ncbi:MAG: DMT family transporter [Planctomycetota bacterium]|nr:DMT family transporter [Planctomycetota bacterium]
MNTPSSSPAPAPTSAALGITLILTTLVGWSSVPLFIKHFASTIDLWTSNGWRYGFSAIIWAPTAILATLSGRADGRLWKAALTPSFFNAAGQTCFAWSFYEIDPGLATFGLRMQIVFVALGAYVLFSAERAVIRRPGYLAGALLVLAGTLGTLLLSPGGSSTFETDHGQTFGFILAVLGGFFFACYALSVRYFMQGVSSITAFSVISQYTALIMVGLMMLLGTKGGATAFDLPAAQLGLLLLSAIIGIALGHVMYYAAIARLGVAVSSGVVQLQPVLVTAASWPLFGERMTPTQLACGVVAIFGAGLMLAVQHSLSKTRREAREMEEAQAEQA